MKRVPVLHIGLELDATADGRLIEPRIQLWAAVAVFGGTPDPALGLSCCAGRGCGALR